MPFALRKDFTECRPHGSICRFACQTACFAAPNGLFGKLKRPVLQRKTGRYLISLNIKQLSRKRISHDEMQKFITNMHGLN